MTPNKFPAALLGQHVAIVGKTGSGKTYTAKGAVETLLTEKRRVCVLDPTGVWYGLRSSPDGKKPGFSIAVFGGAHADVAIAENSGLALAKIVASKNLPVIVDLSEMLIGQRHRFMTDFAEALYRENRAPLHLVIDEADEFAPQNPLPETKRMLHHVDRIVRRGRVRGFRVMLITQRPAVLHKNVLTQANSLIAMRLTAPQDRAAIKAWIEGQADVGQSAEVLGSLARLQRGEGWVWAPEADLLTRMTFPNITTFDSGRTPEDDEVLVEPTKLAAVDLSEVKATFQAAEQDLKTVEALSAQVKDLRAQLARVAAGGVPEAEVRRRIAEAVAKVPNVAAPAWAPTKSLLAAVDKIASGLQVVQEQIGSAGGAGAPAARQPRATAPGLAPAPRQREAAPAPGPVADGVSAPQQRILDVLASLEAFGLEVASKPMLAAHAGVSPTSGGYFNNLGKLRSTGLIDYPAGGEVALTEAGRAIANKPGKAPTLADLHSSWLRIVSNPQAAILEVVLGIYPQSIGKDDLADRVGVSRTSGGYFNNLGHLRTLGAIDYPQKGMVQATAILFPNGGGHG